MNTATLEPWCDLYLREEFESVFQRQIRPRLELHGTCWRWTGCKSKKGYGRITVYGQRNKKTWAVHKFMWEALHGPMAQGLVSDHLCRNRDCCNPEHIEAVTPQVNTLRGFGPGALNSQKTHCPHGHPYTPENTRITYGRRRCRSCIRIAKKKKRQSI